MSERRLPPGGGVVWNINTSKTFQKCLHSPAFAPKSTTLQVIALNFTYLRSQLFTMGYHDITILTSKEAGEVTKAQFEEILTEFFRISPIQATSFNRDPSIERVVIEDCLTHGLDRERSIHAAKTATMLTELAFPLHSREVKIAAARYTAYTIEVDDMGNKFLDEVRSFRRDMLLGELQLPLLRSCKAILSELDRHYDQFCSDKFTTSMINHFAASVIEFEMNEEFTATKTSPKFPGYFRAMSGLPEPFGYFVLCREAFSPEAVVLYLQAASDLVDFINLANDLISFYKESIVSTERHNYVYQRAITQGISAHEVLRRIPAEIMETIVNIKSVFSADLTLSKYMDAFIHGYLWFHLSCPRYKISQLNIPTLNRPVFTNEVAI